MKILSLLFLVLISTYNSPYKLKSNLNGIEFSFDDGPYLGRTDKVFQILKQNNLRAIFFVQGINLVGTSKNAIARRKLIKEMYDEGFIIGNHSFDHKNLCAIPIKDAIWQIDKTSQIIKNITGADVRYFRYPYGSRCKTIDAVLKTKHLASVFWDIDPQEWRKNKFTGKYKTKEQIINYILTQYKALHKHKSNLILLLHDTKKITPELLPELLTTISNL